MLSDKLRAAVLRHALRAYPEECCGLIVSGRYRPCANSSSTPTEAFSISPEDWAQAEDSGDVEAVAHSHPDGAAS
jgi:proteasome lid subunit RPN8/RPN11